METELCNSVDSVSGGRARELHGPVIVIGFDLVELCCIIFSSHPHSQTSERGDHSSAGRLLESFHEQNHYASFGNTILNAKHHLDPVFAMITSSESSASRSL